MPKATKPDRPTYKRTLLERAKEVEHPVTDVEINDTWEQPVIRAHAIQEYNGTAYRALICGERGDGEPSVSFARCNWDADAETLRGWSSLATGRLTGPQRLSAWESLFTVFEAGLDAYEQGISKE